MAANGKQGSGASSPWAIPGGGWLAALKRTWKEAGDDNVGLISAGVAFYAFLSIVPLMGAVVLTYGIVADPKTVSGNVAQLTQVMPAQVAKLIGQQLLQVVGTSGGKKGVGLVIALAIALYGATKGAGAIVTALNIAYDEKETRGFVRINLVQLGIVAGGVLVALAAIASTALMALVGHLLAGAPGILLASIRVGSYLLLGVLAATAAAALFRWGPSRAEARWAWLTPGSVGATVIWIAMTVGFGLYVANFGSYDATYGSLGAIVVMLTWLSLSAYVFLLGAELNSELERQAQRSANSEPAATRTPIATRPGAQRDAGPVPPVVPAIVAAAGLAMMKWGRFGGVALLGIAGVIAARARRSA